MDKTVKFRIKNHETFPIRKNWLGKGMKYVSIKPDVFTDKNTNPMDVLGIGSNMVRSLRYWLTSVGLIEEVLVGKKKQARFTDFGSVVFEHDRYAEEIGTLWLLHYNLVKEPSVATSWYYFFNELNLSEFSKEDFVDEMAKFLEMNQASFAKNSVADDFSCIVNTYMPRYKTNPGRENPEDNLECPLSELGLVDYQNRKEKLYKKTSPVKNSLPALVALAVILEQAGGEREVLLSSLQNDIGNIGKVFNLDIVSLLDILLALERQGYVQLVRTAGLDVVRIGTDMTFIDCVNKYYEELAND